MPPVPKQEAFDYTVTLAFHRRLKSPSVKINAFVKQLIGKVLLLFTMTTKVYSWNVATRTIKGGELYKNTNVATFEFNF